MIALVDANLLLYAEDSLSLHHDAAREWWDARLSDTTTVGLCWQVVTAFVRIGTNPRLHKRPLTVKEAVARIESWFQQPCVRVLVPGESHWGIFQRMLQAGAATGNLVSDAHLAALAIEHGATLYSSDADFGRFKGLNWINPL